MPTLKPLQWLIHSPVALLPMLAALFIQRPAPGWTAWPLNSSDVGLLLRHHWLWLGVALGLGVWVGWYTAVARTPHQEPEQEADAP